MIDEKTDDKRKSKRNWKKACIWVTSIDSCFVNYIFAKTAYIMLKEWMHASNVGFDYEIYTTFMYGRNKAIKHVERVAFFLARNR